MIASNQVKRTFKVYLDSNNTASYSGAQFNATYPIDLTHIIFDESAYDKSYLMYVNFQSAYGTPAVTTINNNLVYTLHVDMGKGLNVFQYRQVKNPSAILQLYYDGTNVGWNTVETDNMPTFVQNIRNMSAITLNVIDTSTNSTFNSADNSTINTATKYVCCLTFVEA